MTVTGLHAALLFGALIGLGVGLLVYKLFPAQPDLSDVLSRLSPPARARVGAVVSASPDTEERLGIWAQRTLPARLLGAPPARDLAVLRQTPAQFYGRKMAFGILGLVLPALLTGFFTLLRITVPVVVPAGGTLILSVVLFMMPSRDIREAAMRARSDFARALSAYIELCALERNAGAGASVALANAAQVGDSWVFRRISEELARSRYNGQPPWDSLTVLADDLGLPELTDVADIMRLANDESSEVYRQLRARSASARSALLSSELAQANLVEERMYLPASFLGLVFLALLMTPPLLRLFSAG